MIKRHRPPLSLAASSPPFIFIFTDSSSTTTTVTRRNQEDIEMSTYNPSMGDVDIIFAGGGTAACVAAGRLAKADPELKILLVEGGKNNFNDPTVVNPVVFLSHLAPDSQSALFYKANASKFLNGREAIVPMGGLLGGGSSINFMVYTRAQGVDFDSWNTEGWAAKDMIAMCKKLETFHPKDPAFKEENHGYDGPIHVSDGGYRGKSEELFMDTVKKMGYKEIVDLQDFEDCGGFSKWSRYVSPDGKRQDSAHRYIHPLLQDGQHPNLHILLQSKVIRVLFDESSPPRAIGIEYKPNPDHQPNTALSKPIHRIIKANKLVVVSAGALGTPQVLERSGVGNPEILKRLDIPVVADVPGVGENYQDHNLMFYPFKSSLDETETIDGILSGRKDFVKAKETRDPIIGWNAVDVCGKLRPTDAEVATLGPDFKKNWDRDFAHAPSRPLMLCGILNTFLGDPSLVAPGQYFTVGDFSPYPYSRGRIHITSKEDVPTGYDFDAGFLSHPSDIKKQIWAYKMSREIARRLPYYEGELALGHPKFKEDSKAALVDGRKDVTADLEYSKEDDEAIEDWIRGNLNTTWHSLGTCAMRPLEDGGVVDKYLNVHGTRGLKVADLSMVPENVAANTNNTALAVGEKAAVIIGAPSVFETIWILDRESQGLFPERALPLGNHTTQIAENVFVYVIDATNTNSPFHKTPLSGHDRPNAQPYIHTQPQNYAMQSKHLLALPMFPPSTRIRKHRAPQQPLPAHKTPSVVSRRRSSRIESRQRSAPTPHILGSYYESQSPPEQRQMDSQTLQPLGPALCTRVPTSGSVETSPPVPSKGQFQEYLGLPQTNNHQTRKRRPESSNQAVAENPPKRARLTKENLKAFEKMGKRLRNDPKSKSSRSEPSLSRSQALSRSVPTTTSTNKTLPTTDSNFPRLAFDNGILDPDHSVPPTNLSFHQDQLDRARDTASPSESEYKAFCHRIRRAPNEMTMVIETSRLLKEHDEGYSRVYNQAFNDFPKDVGFNNGLSAAQPDMIEGFEMTKFNPFPVRQELGGAAVLTSERDPLTLPHLAGEWKGAGKNMILAETQAAYNGAHMVYSRNEARLFLNKPDPSGYAYVRTFIIDGTILNTYAHYSSEIEDQVKYYQYPTSSSLLISSYKDFKKSRRRLRNLQDDAKETSEKLKDELNEKWLADHQPPVASSVPADTTDFYYEDRKGPSFPTNNHFNSSVQIPAADTMCAPPNANFPANNKDDSFVQVSTANNGLLIPSITPPQSSKDTLLPLNERGHKRTRWTGKQAVIVDARKTGRKHKD
ncbi:hypothetical protein B7494_g575 [Chlorociboria aeruginascens]|nr:hypothetical protein B7494_g575 [Chlorociboria aeruginascens]